MVLHRLQMRKDFENNTTDRVSIVSCLSDEVFDRVVGIRHYFNDAPMKIGDV